MTLRFKYPSARLELPINPQMSYPIPTYDIPFSTSSLAEQTPVLNLERGPDARRILDSIADELALTTELKVNVFFVVLSLDMGHVDGDEDVSLDLFEAQESHYDGGEVGGVGGVAGLLRLGGLGRDEGVGGCSVFEAGELGLGGIPDLDSVDVRSNHVLEMRRHGASVNLRASARTADSFGDVKDDARKAILVDPDFLVIGNLSKLADVGKVGGEVGDDCATKEGSTDELGHVCFGMPGA